MHRLLANSTGLGGYGRPQKAPLNKPSASEFEGPTTRPWAKHQQTSSPRGDLQPSPSIRSTALWPLLTGHTRLVLCPSPGPTRSSVAQGWPPARLGLSNSAPPRNSGLRSSTH
ncbi:hypothetical protein NDU88_005584 [Pleurodeles waltl]|uniref:Uncharacterized protein n=1 Tax=Pleurodeles waltl TaxID=8319 RepID=A0AAV7WB26_PLEWA|nr:hypothetical protein NDU88_005584 [Pleurodeles waltl]